MIALAYTYVKIDAVPSILSLSLFLKLCRLLLCFVYIPVECGAGDPKPPADVLHRLCFLLIEFFCQSDFLRRKRFGPSAVSSSGACRLKPGAGTLVNNVPLKFGQCCENVKHEFAG